MVAATPIQTNGVTERKPLNFMEEVHLKTPGDPRLLMCIQCGTCGGSCPSGPDMDHGPRKLFAMIRAGMRKQVLESNTAWYCVSCYFCMVRCPQEVHITDVMYTLKSMAIEEGYADGEAGRDLSSSFVDLVEEYGRSFEFGLATRQNLKHRLASMTGTARIGLGMLTKGRMELTPERINNLSQLQSILKRAKELEEEIHE